MKHNYKADLITIGQWIENKICFDSVEKPLTSNKKYEEIGEKFVRYVKMVEDNLMFLPKDELHEYDIHATMKYLVAYRLTPHAIAFAHKYQDELSFTDEDILKGYDTKHVKNVMYLSDKALCNFHITIRPSWNLKNVCMHTRDYFEQYQNEKFVVELDGLESLEAGEGRTLVENALYVMSDVAVLVRAGFLHYGDYECDEGMERVERLAKFYESLGFENVNDTIGCYEESIMMLSHKDKIKELEDDREV